MRESHAFLILDLSVYDAKCTCVRILLCYLLSCIGATALRNAAQFGRGTGPIWLAQVGCTLDDTSLANCTLGIPIGTNSCGHGQDAGVICFTEFSK